MKQAKRTTQRNKCRYCGKPVRISLESFEYSEKEGYWHLECLKEKGDYRDFPVMKQYYIQAGARKRLLFKCVREGCRHLSTQKDGYCCIWCGRSNEIHRKRHTAHCELRDVNKKLK